MPATQRPRRSVLFMPASNVRALEKARSLAADVIIMDLEDAVSPDMKDVAREQALAAVSAGGYGQRELVIRANGTGTNWHDADIDAIALSGANAILLAKVESAGEVRRVEARLVDAGAPEELAIWCMIESPRGVLAAAEIAGAGRRMAALVMGTSDLTKDLQARHTPGREPMMTSLGLCLLAARAHGLAILDGVHLDLSDDVGLAEVCRQGAEMGFDGKTLIHPKTLDIANRSFGPDAETIAWSRRVIQVHADAEAAGSGVVLLDGQLIENLHVEEARRIMRLAEMIEALESVGQA
ncbi:MAG: CoA ester lyase [Alphaproteobacteria bacterium]|nr:CoA ester lyase [Alphaproteobacteria bacterium]